MHKAIITSKDCIAGQNIKQRLLETGEFSEKDEKFDGHAVYSIDKYNTKLYTINEKHIFADDIDKKINADLFIFASTHTSQSGIPSLSAHPVGNWAKPELGGRDRELVPSPSRYIREAIKKLEEIAGNGKTDFDIMQEATHHGPYLEKPCMFIEIGADEKQWVREDAGNIIAETIMHLISKEPERTKTVFGIGGPHGTPNFRKLILKHNLSLGHVCPKYMLSSLDKEMILKAMEKHTEKPELIVLDWKGMGTEKDRIVKLLEELNIEYKKTKGF